MLRRVALLRRISSLLLRRVALALGGIVPALLLRRRRAVAHRLLLRVVVAALLRGRSAVRSGAGRVGASAVSGLRVLRGRATVGRGFVVLA